MEARKKRKQNQKAALADASSTTSRAAGTGQQVRDGSASRCRQPGVCPMRSGSQRSHPLLFQPRLAELKRLRDKQRSASAALASSSPASAGRQATKRPKTDTSSKKGAATGTPAAAARLPAASTNRKSKTSTGGRHEVRFRIHLCALLLRAAHAGGPFGSLATPLSRCMCTAFESSRMQARISKAPRPADVHVAGNAPIQYIRPQLGGGQADLLPGKNHQGNRLHPG